MGNNRVVADANVVISQRTHYYPFGLPFADGAEQDKQPYKYNNKEFDTMHGLNQYDYHARFYDSTLPRFTTVDPLAEKYYSSSPYVYCNNNPLRYIDPTGESWKPTYDEDRDGNKTYNGYEWVDEADSYDAKGNLLPGLYAQAIFFSDNGTYNSTSGKNLGSSTATVYLADGTTTEFDAATNPSDPKKFATIPEGFYHATVGTHTGSKSSYTALKMTDTKGSSNIELDKKIRHIPIELMLQVSIFIKQERIILPE